MNRGVQRRRLSAWVYVAVLLGMDLIWAAVFGRKNIGQLKERWHPGPGARDGLLDVFLFLLPPWIAHYVVAWLDISRYHWSDKVPYRAQIVGLVGVAFSAGVLLWARTVNPFFSTVVRIQRDRGQRVITGGPYQYVRHPGYIAGIGMVLFGALALGSLLSLIPAAGTIPFILRRTILEDKVLRDELEGYEQYAKKVRYRLIPGIW